MGSTKRSKKQIKDFILKSPSHFDGLHFIPQRLDYNFKLHPSCGWITSGTHQRTKHISKTQTSGPGLKLWAAIQGLHKKKPPTRTWHSCQDIWQPQHLREYSVRSLFYLFVQAPALLFKITKLGLKQPLLSKELFLELESGLPLPCANDRNCLTFMGM